MRAAVLLLLVALPVLAAPVPKSLKGAPTLDGVWQVVEYNGMNGQRPAQAEGTYWRVEGESFGGGEDSIKKLTSDNLPHLLRIPDPKKPHLREYHLFGGEKYSAVVDLDGDTLRFAWAPDATKTISECKPADDMYYYVFRRVKDK